MEASPLVQDTRPAFFEPKVVSLYKRLFEPEVDLEDEEGFWLEFFLLRPHASSLQEIIEAKSPTDLLNCQHACHELLRRSSNVIAKGQGSEDENALDTLTVFLGSILNKRFSSPSTDILDVLAGLDEADFILPQLVRSLDAVIRNGKSIALREKAVRVAIAMVSGAYQTGIVSYFTQRDLFPSLMKMVQDTESPSQGVDPVILLGLLANYNKFEFQNPYKLRLEDFVNENAINKAVQSVAYSTMCLRDAYVALQDDSAESWTLGGALSYVGFTSLMGKISEPKEEPPNAEEAKLLFNKLPGTEISLLLAVYDFSNANKLFCSRFISNTSDTKDQEAAFPAFLSLSSYLLEHAYRSERATSYAYLSLFIILLLVEDYSLAKAICNPEQKVTVRLCRQRPPYLPAVKGPRPPALFILDIILDGINHNLRRKLDVQLHVLCISSIQRVISFLSRSRVRFAYHWSEFWRSLLSFVRFLTTYADDIRMIPDSEVLVDQLVTLLALALSTGDSFLPDAAAYDDLFYKLVENGETLAKLRDAYGMSKRPSADAVETLLNVVNHYHELITEQKSKRKTLTPKEVTDVIKSGYETLSIQAKEGLDHWDKYREADHRTILKRITRVVASDTRLLLSQR